MKAVLPWRAPNLIGGTGGSGTRVFARIAQALGMFIGSDLNGASDALAFRPFLYRWINEYLRYTRAWDAADLNLSDMQKEFDQTLHVHCASLTDPNSPWGWKQPRNLYVLPFLHCRLPRMRLLHVVRDGRDMAYSSNQKHLANHGAALLTEHELQMPEPVQSITLWSRINCMAATFGQSVLGDRYLVVRFEDLCEDPVAVIDRVARYFRISAIESEISRIAEREVICPASIGRWQSMSLVPGSALVKAGLPGLTRFGYV